VPYLIRVRVPDQPGALGRLATALGAVRADIESVAVVDRQEGVAVDDLIVAMPPPALADVLVTAVHSVPGVVLETIQPHPGRARVYDELALLDDATTARDPVTTLVAGLPDLFAARYAFAVAADAPDPVVAASPGAPDSGVRSDWLPLREARVVAAAELFTDPAAAGPDCALVAAAIGERSAVVLGRNGGAEFRPAEVYRLAHLASVLRAARHPYA
jgi:hypothetical protein